MFLELASLHIKMAAFIALVLAATSLARRSSAQNRYLVLKFALAVVALFPVLSFALPNYPIDLPWWPKASLNSAPIFTDASAADVRMVSAQNGIDILGLSVGIYFAVGIGLLLQTLLFYLRSAAEIRRYGRVEDSDTMAEFERALDQLQVRQNVELVTDSSGAGPYVWGIRRALIAIPKEFSAAPIDVQRTVLSHELVHVLRQDFAVCLFSRMLACTYWINPVVWWLNARLKLEMERSCDDRVVCSGINSVDYAAHLLKAVKRFGTAHGPSAAVAMSRESSIKLRIVSLLNHHKRRGLMNTSKSVSTAAAVLMLGVAIGAFAANSTREPLRVARADAPSIANRDALVASVKRLVPENCSSELREINVSDSAMQFKGQCGSLPPLSTFMRNLANTGANPRLLRVEKKDASFDYAMRVENPAALSR